MVAKGAKYPLGEPLSRLGTTIGRRLIQRDIATVANVAHEHAARSKTAARSLAWGRKIFGLRLVHWAGN
jgi:hypothetical protein